MLQMDKGEIVREYRTASDKRAQLGILADLNACSKAEIAEILIAAGEKVDGRWYYIPKNAKNQWKTAEEIAAEEPAPEAASPLCITAGKLIELLGTMPPELPVMVGKQPLVAVFYWQVYSAGSGFSESVELMPAGKEEAK